MTGPCFGSSVPEIDPGDVANIPIVRLAPDTEAAIADHAEESARLRTEADALDRGLAEAAGKLIDRFIAGDQAGPTGNVVRLPVAPAR
jgi:hypothetical protein